MKNNPDILLEMRNITKVFSGTKALDGVNLQVRKGTIHALVGENGAGKSTLMNVLSGLYPYGTYTGEIWYENHLCKFRSLKESEAAGIVIIHQELALVPEMTIAENMTLGNEPGYFFWIDKLKSLQLCQRHLSLVGLAENPETPVKNLGVGQQQMLEIARALAKKSTLLILDEPTAALNDLEAAELLNLLRRLREQGMTIILISHKLKEVFSVADEITVIRDGSTIQTLSKDADGFSEDMIIRCMVGRNLSCLYPTRQPNIGEVFFEVKNWTVWHPVYKGVKCLDRVSFNIRRGEIVGLAGLMGAGRTELARSLFGKSYGADFSGEIWLDGKPLECNTVSEAVKSGLAYVTENRLKNGVVPGLSVQENIPLANLKEIFFPVGMLNETAEKDVAEQYREQLKIRCSNVEQATGSLSGGNMQKVLLAKWLFSNPKLLILDEPTRGIDVGAKYEIYCLINELVEAGKSILLISSEMAEVIGLCDRIYVMNEGAIAGEFTRAEVSSEKIMECIQKHSGRTK